MSYVQPNGVVKLLRGIPLDPSYNHTWYFEDADEQRDKFSTYSKATLSKQSYRRVSKNTITVGILADNIQDINYMMFQNWEDGEIDAGYYSGKWYYAFVLKVDYVNDHTSEITYEIDKIQTWMFDWRFGQCFVERQHQAGNDSVGVNIVDEGLEVGEYVSNKTEHFDLSEQHVLVLSTAKPTETSDMNAGLAHNGIYSGLKNNPTTLKIRSNRYDFRVHWEVSSDNLQAKISNVTPVPDSANYIIAPVPPGDTSTETALAAHPVLAVKKPTGVSTANRCLIEAYYQESYFIVKATQWDDRSQSTPVKINIEGDAEDYWEYDQNNNTYRLPFMYNTNGTINCTCYIDSSWYTSTTQDGIEVKEYIDSFADDSAIVNIFQYPAWIDKDVGAAGTLTDELAKEEKPVRMNNLNVINKKCYCYPYNHLVVCNNVGQNAEYRWENGFYNASRGTNQINFNIIGTRWGTPTVFMYPVGYRGMINDFESGITLNNFPNCSWTGDVYKTWWNQNKNSAHFGMIMGTLNSALSLASSAAEGSTSGIVSSTAGMVNSVGSLVAKKQDMKAIPPSSQGQYANDGINNAMGRTGFTFYWMSAKPQNLEIIDSYFQMYGYKQLLVTTPNIHARAKYTYIKTNGCIIHPKAGKGYPAEAEKEITAIFDKGITFWVPSAEIGEYFNPNNRQDDTWNAPI